MEIDSASHFARHPPRLGNYHHINMQSLPACCLLAALLSLSTAFLLPPPTFIANMPRSSPANIPRISPATLLNMGLFDRFARVAKANLNNVLKTLEE